MIALSTVTQSDHDYTLDLLQKTPELTHLTLLEIFIDMTNIEAVIIIDQFSLLSEGNTTPKEVINSIIQHKPTLILHHRENQDESTSAFAEGGNLTEKWMNFQNFTEIRDLCREFISMASENKEGKQPSL